MKRLPTGTVTFLFTDIEGSTALLQHLGDHRYAEVLEEHKRLLREAFAKGNGHEIETQGDAILVAFPRARDAVAAAVEAQQAVTRYPWPQDAAPRVRMGLHTGEPLSGTVGYVGLDVHRAARICGAGHGGQILLSDVTQALVAKDLPEGVSLRDLGEHRLKDLVDPERLYQVVAADLLTEFPPPRSVGSALHHNLPSQLTSFIGREREIADVKAMLASARLVTLTGPGGSGKTRLALRVGADLVGQRSDGVWLIELASLTDGALVPQALATALGVTEQARQPLVATLTDYLAPKSLLLVVDNCEHILTACAQLANALLRACPTLSILATSREALGIDGEVLYPIPALSVPDPERLPSIEALVRYESVRLFTDRATSVVPTFRITPQNATAIARICHQLDGIPLAIELAAVWVKTLAVDQIVNRLSDRFQLLTGGSRTALARHQTLRAAMDWSYELLSEKEQATFRRLSVFAGGCTLDSAEPVCSGNDLRAAQVLDLLAQLVGKSLVIAETQQGEARYRLLETVRQYGREKLIGAGEASAFLGRHLNWYLALAEQAERELRGPAPRAWLTRLDAEHDNLRSALAWSQATEEGVESGLRLAAALCVYWLRRGHWSEGRQRLADVLWQKGAQQLSSPRAKALYAAGQMAEAQDQDAEAGRYFQKASAVYQHLKDEVGTARSLHSLGMISHKQNDQNAARAHFEESLTLFRECADKSGIATVLSDLAEVVALEGDNASAHLMLLESLAMRRELGDVGGIGTSLNDLGQLARLQGDYQRAATLYRESLISHLESGSKAAIAGVRNNLGFALLHMGDYQQATTLFRESLVDHLELESKSGISESIAGLASLAVARGHLQRAARLLSISDGLMESVDHTFDLVDRSEFNQSVATVRSSFDEATFNETWAEGRAMTLEQAIAYALAGGTD